VRLFNFNLRAAHAPDTRYVVAFRIKKRQAGTTKEFYCDLLVSYFFFFVHFDRQAILEVSLHPHRRRRLDAGPTVANTRVGVVFFSFGFSYRHDIEAHSVGVYFSETIRQLRSLIALLSRFFLLLSQRHTHLKVCRLISFVCIDQCTENRSLYSCSWL